MITGDHSLGATPGCDFNQQEISMDRHDEDIAYLANKALTLADYKRLQLLVEAHIAYAAARC